jgi:acyl-CoA synthetase (AMP-forming)/AMP-acid ligase II
MTVALFGSMVELLRRRARGNPDRRAYAYLSDQGSDAASLSFAELERRATAVAARLALRGAPGERALLLCPPGLDFMVGFFGCLLAGVIAVPMMLPRRNSARDAADSILADCGPRFALTTASVLDGARGNLLQRFAAAGLEWIALDDGSLSEGGSPDASLAIPRRDDIAMLQYTSGSTSAPKGVVVSHANLLDNLEMIRIASGNSENSTYVSWVPLYHDMGLILNALQALYVGATCVLMAPVNFVRHPLTWLRAISTHRAEVAGGPNFAFDLCVSRYQAEQMSGIDLSCWKVAFTGAEHVRAETIARFDETFAPHGFDSRAFWPGYGMAEASVLISAGHRGRGAVTRAVSRASLQRHVAEPPGADDDAQVLVGCGRELSGERIAIVDPQTCRRLRPLQLGEVWVSGANVARGYWRNDAATQATFAASIDGEEAADWLRTGDLGCLDADGELYITGRIKELIIIRGINHYPQDIEYTVQRCHPALAAHGGAAFAVEEGDGAERLVVVQEVERTLRHALEPGDVIATIREAIVDEHEIAPHRIVLLRPGALPKTSSGKIQRYLARELWRQNRLEVL